MNERLKKLGAEVARTQDKLLTDPKHRDAVRRRLANEPAPLRRPSSSRTWLPWAASASAVAVAAAVLLLWTRSPGTVTYNVGGGQTSTVVDEPIRAAEGQALSVAFSDDSWVQLSPGARARVDELTRVGASVNLEEGEATVYVRARPGTVWSVRAGPFRVEVTGTTFRVAWRPSDETFALSVFEGEVQVSGPGIGTRAVREGDQVDVSLRSEPVPSVAPSTPDPVVTPPPPAPVPIVVPDPRPEPRAVPPSPPRAERRRKPRPTQAPPRRAEPEAPPAPAPQETEPAETPQPAPVSPEPSQEPPKPSPLPEALAQEPPPAPESVEAPAAPLPKPPAIIEKPEWQKLIEQGDYEGALSSLTSDQIGQAIERSDLGELVKLAATARRVGDPRAKRLYRGIRSRFPQSDAAAQAAFILARIDFHDGSFREAAVWLETYVRERPKGRFAREASGRLIEAYRRGGNEKGARVAAKRYLARYPDGPHAELARSVLQ